MENEKIIARANESQELDRFMTALGNLFSVKVSERGQAEASAICALVQQAGAKVRFEIELGSALDLKCSLVRGDVEQGLFAVTGGYETFVVADGQQAN